MIKIWVAKMITAKFSDTNEKRKMSYFSDRGANLPLGPELPKHGTAPLSWIPSYPHEMSRQMYLNGANVLPAQDLPPADDMPLQPYGASRYAFPEWVPWFEQEQKHRRKL